MFIYLVKSKNDLRRSLVLLWLSGNFLFYHLGTYLLGVYLCPCLGRLTDRLPLPQGSAEVALKFLVLYWFVTSLNRAWREWGSALWVRLFPTRNGILPGPSPRHS